MADDLTNKLFDYLTNRLSDSSTIRLSDKENKMPLTVEALMAKMPAAFLPEKAPGLDAVIQFKFSGAEAGEWYAAIKDGKCAVEKGTHSSPKMT